MVTQDKITKMRKKSERITNAGKSKIKKHTCSECFWYNEQRKECCEGRLNSRMNDLKPNTQACQCFFG